VNPESWLTGLVCDLIISDFESWRSARVLISFPLPLSLSVCLSICICLSGCGDERLQFIRQIASNSHLALTASRRVPVLAVLVYSNVSASSSLSTSRWRHSTASTTTSSSSSRSVPALSRPTTTSSQSIHNSPRYGNLRFNGSIMRQRWSRDRRPNAKSHIYFYLWRLPYNRLSGRIIQPNSATSFSIRDHIIVQNRCNINWYIQNI